MNTSENIYRKIFIGIIVFLALLDKLIITKSFVDITMMQRTPVKDHKAGMPAVEEKTAARAAEAAAVEAEEAPAQAGPGHKPPPEVWYVYLKDPGCVMTNRNTGQRFVNN